MTTRHRPHPEPVMDPFQVIRRPHVSEKAHALVQERNTYVFEVDARATKVDIKNAVQKIWNVKVEAVRTISQKGKAKRFGRFAGKAPDRKKAIVRLAEGQGIDALR